MKEQEPIKWPFVRRRGIILCFNCGSARGNTYWGCPACAPSKPDLIPGYKDGRFSDEILARDDEYKEFIRHQWPIRHNPMAKEAIRWAIKRIHLNTGQTD